MKTKARSCAKNHGIKVLMGEMTDIPTGTTTAPPFARSIFLAKFCERAPARCCCFQVFF